MIFRLEFKYMKLVEGAQGAGELPAAQTCAWSDDEEELDSDKVAFKTKGDQLFGKLGRKDKVREVCPCSFVYVDDSFAIGVGGGNQPKRLGI